MNIGHSSSLIYDKCAYDDRLAESTAPLAYRLNPASIAHCDACLSTLGPRGATYGASTLVGHRTAPSQDLVDLESVLTNRNVRASRCKDGKVNDIDVTKFRLQHARACNNFLDPVSSRLTNPAANYRGIGINRFHDLDRDPMKGIYWSVARNTTLEAKDNHRERRPQLVEDKAGPTPKEGGRRACKLDCQGDCPECTYQMSM